MTLIPPGLPADFNRLWFAQTVSAFGSQITTIALPLTAILVLEATPVQMGWLNAAQQLPMAAFGLLAGVIVDRMRRKPILVIGDFAQGAILLSIPAAAFAGSLGLIQLYAVAFAVGSIRVVAAVADRTYLPSLLPQRQLVAGNSRIWFSYSLAQTAGPGVAGVLVNVLTAPITIVIDALSFIVSGFSLLSIRYREPVPRQSRQSTFGDVRHGFREVFRNPVLRQLVLCGAQHNIFSTMIVTIYFLYVTRDLVIDPAVLGAILIAGGIGSVVGSSFASRASSKLGDGSALIVLQVLTGVARILIPLAAGSWVAVVVVLAFSEFLLGLVRAMFNIIQISMRQTLIPRPSLGRVNASIGFILWAFTPAGALAAGYLGNVIGLKPTLWIGAAGVLLATAWTLPRSMRTYRLEPGSAGSRD